MTQPVRTFVKNFGVVVAAILAVLGWAITSGWTAVDHRYVHSDSFTVWHQRDSLNQQRNDAETKRILYGLDSSDKCNRKLRNYCR